MRIFKSKTFQRWADKEGLSDLGLRIAVAELERGLIDADLGGGVFKKRVAITGRGKSGGLRTLLAYKKGDRIFFIYGFAKNVKANITSNELQALKTYAHILLTYSETDVNQAVLSGALIEVTRDE
jgi:hypothetical protein